jgi:hypothetical protein
MKPSFVDNLSFTSASSHLISGFFFLELLFHLYLLCSLEEVENNVVQDQQPSGNAFFSLSFILKALHGC